MDFQRDGREPVQAREADAGLSARVRRMSLLWWAAAYVVLCLLNFTTEPPEAWPSDLVAYAGGSLVAFGWSLLVARRLTSERRRLGREAVWEGLGLGVLGGCVCGVVASVLNQCVFNYLKLDVPAALLFEALVASGNYAVLCVGWCFIYLVISSAERLVRLEEEISSLRVVAYDSQNVLFYNEFRLDYMSNAFAELDHLLSLCRQPESQEVVVAVAAKLRSALDRWSHATRRAEQTGEAGGGDAGSSAPGLVVKAVMNLNIANVIFWIGIFVFFSVVMDPYYVANSGIRGGVSWGICWISFCTTGAVACVALERLAKCLLMRSLWVKCACVVMFSVVASYLLACAPWGVWEAIAKRLDFQPYFVFSFYYSCSYVVWFCLYFYAQAVRREVSQRALLAQAAEAAAAARNSVLRYQVRPHFLFNALNALFALIADRRWAAARDMTRALSQYIERAFAQDERELVPIGEQVEALRAYLGLEKIRFGDRLSFRAEIPERLAFVCAPSLILHPLVENAMKYAVAATAEPVEVEIAADLIGDTLRLRVRDTGGDPEAPAAPGLGIGLRNVAARLAGHYGERGLLQCKLLTPKGFVAEIWLPLEFACIPSAA